MITSIVSLLLNKPVKEGFGMTGEISLRGHVLPIGGLKEKLLAAKRGGIKRVIIPQDNEADLREIPSQITSSLEIIPVRWVDELISLALTSVPKPLKKKRARKNITKRKISSQKSTSVKPH